MRRPVISSVVAILCVGGSNAFFFKPIGSWKAPSCHTLYSAALPISADTEVETKAPPRHINIPEVRRELIELLRLDPPESAEIAAARNQRQKYLMDTLEEIYVPAQTIPFFNFALQGDWELLYSSWRSRRDRSEDAAPAVTVESTVQRLEPENWGGKMTNIINWNYQEGSEVYNGSLTVHSTYTINSRAALVVSLEEHRLETRRTPKDPNSLIVGLQRLVPFDLFDPNSTVIETNYLDHEIRILTTVSDKFRSPVKSVFIR